MIKISEGEKYFCCASCGIVKDEETMVLHIQAIHRNNTILTLTLCENCLEELEREIKKWKNSHHTSEIF